MTAKKVTENKNTGELSAQGMTHKEIWNLYFVPCSIEWLYDLANRCEIKITKDFSGIVMGDKFYVFK